MRVRTHLPAVPSIDRADTTVSAPRFRQLASGSHRVRLLALSAAALFLAAGPGRVLGQTSSQTTTLPEVTVEAKKGAKKQAAQKKQPAAKGPAQAQNRTQQQQETATGPVKGYAATVSATGSKTDTPLSQIPQSVSVVGAQQIRDQGATTIQETLRYVPGVYADAYGADSRGDFPRMRGADPDIFLDGLRLSDAWRFGENRLDAYTLERVEVLKGPSSMLYGQTSVAGLINAVSKRPQEETYREVGIEVGSFDRLRFQTDMTGKLTEDGKWLYRFIGISQQADMQTDFVDNDRMLIAPSITYRPNTGTILTLLAKYQKDDSGSATSFLPHEGTIKPGYLGQRIPINRFVSEPGFDEYKTETTSIAAIFEHKVNDALTVRQNARYWRTDNIYHSIYPNWASIDPLDPRTVTRYAWMNDVVRDNFASDSNAELKFRTSDIAHKLLVGFDHRRIYQSSKSAFDEILTPFDLYNPVYNGYTPPSMTDDPDQLQTQSGVYVQDQLRYGNWIGILGIRHDWAANKVDERDTEKVEKTTYRAGIMYELPFGLTPYFSYAQSFNPQYLAGCVPACDPYQGAQYEVGFKYRPTRQFAINGAIFDITEQNRLTYGGGTEPKAIGEARTRGAEIEFVGALTSYLDIIAGYSYTDAKVTKGDEAGKHVPTVPLHQASLWGKYKFSMFGVEGFSAGAGVRYIGDSWGGFDIVKTPGVTLLDAMVGWENRHWRFQVNATNLEDKEYFATCLDRGDCFYGTGRTVISNLTYKF